MNRSVAVVGLALLALATSACGGSTTPASSHATTTVHFPFALGALTAQGSTAAAAPAAHDPQLSGAAQPLHAVIWNEATGGVKALKLPHECADPSTLALGTGTDAVVLCDTSCCTSSEQIVALVRPGANPVAIKHVQSALRAAGERIGGLAGSGNLIVFNVDKLGKSGARSDAVLYRVNGAHAQAITTGANRVGIPVGVARGLILVQRQERARRYENPATDLRVFNADGKIAWTSIAESIPEGLPLPRPLFDGKSAYSVNFYEHWLGATRPDSSYVQHFCVVGPGVTLGGVSGQFVTYTTADAVHVIRTTNCHDAVLKTGGGVPAGSVITPAGVFYAFNKQPTTIMSNEGIAHDPSTLTFVPMTQVRLALQHGLDLSLYRSRP